MGASADATFTQLSICSATRRLRILARLGDLVEPEAWRLCFYVKRAAVLPAGAEVLSPSAMGWGDLPVLDDD